MAEVILERSEIQKIWSNGEEHHEGPAFGRTPDDYIELLALDLID